MDNQRAAQELKVIRELMERPIRFSTLSGLAGIWAGTMALVGLALDGLLWPRLHQQTHLAIAVCGGVWAGVFIAAFTGVWLLTRQREKRRGMPVWSSVKTKVLRTILPPFVAGAGLSLVILARWWLGLMGHDYSQLGLLAPIWMLFYGVALWQLGEFSAREVRVLGAAFILAGLASAGFLPNSPYFPLGVTFGGFHLAYGTVMWIRHGG